VKQPVFSLASIMPIFPTLERNAIVALKGKEKVDKGLYCPIVALMWRLVKYLEESDLEALPRNELVQKLYDIWPTDINNPARPSREHEELAAAVASALWLGRYAQQIKEKTGDKHIEQFFREAMVVAFETGRRLAMTSL
jgi:hypothetical protein